MSKRLKRPHPGKRKTPIVPIAVVVVIIIGVLIAFGSGSEKITEIAPTTVQSDDAQATVTETSVETQEESSDEPIMFSKFINLPTVVDRNQPAFFTWEVVSNVELDEEDKRITHTELHWGPVSFPDIGPITDYPETSRDFLGTVPETFSTSITFNKIGRYYMRVHTIVGTEHVWSDEREILVISPSARTTTLDFVVEADDEGFYLKNKELLEIKPELGQSVKILFKVRDTNVASGGLEFKSDDFGFDTGKVDIDDEAEVKFFVGDNGKIISYEPGTGKVRAELEVIVS